MRACANWIPEKVAQAIKCKEFPKEFDIDQDDKKVYYDHNHRDKDCDNPQHKRAHKKKCRRKSAIEIRERDFYN